MKMRIDTTAEAGLQHVHSSATVIRFTLTTADFSQTVTEQEKLVMHHPPCQINSGTTSCSKDNCFISVAVSLYSCSVFVRVERLVSVLGVV